MLNLKVLNLLQGNSVSASGVLAPSGLSLWYIEYSSSHDCLVYDLSTETSLTPYFYFFLRSTLLFSIMPIPLVQKGFLPIPGQHSVTSFLLTNRHYSNKYGLMVLLICVSQLVTKTECVRVL